MNAPTNCWKENQNKGSEETNAIWGNGLEERLAPSPLHGENRHVLLDKNISNTKFKTIKKKKKSAEAEDPWMEKKLPEIEKPSSASDPAGVIRVVAHVIVIFVIANRMLILIYLRCQGTGYTDWLLITSL